MVVIVPLSYHFATWRKICFQEFQLAKGKNFVQNERNIRIGSEAERERLPLLTSPDETRDLALRFGTPLYLVDIGRVVRGLDRLRDGLVAHYPKSEITYSVKTNYLAGILRGVLAAGYRLEVVSGHELALAEWVGAGPAQILFNGPSKAPEDLEHCYRHGIDFHVDSVEELEQAAALGSCERPVRLGVRVAATLANGTVSRFGVHGDELAAVRRVIAGGTVRLAGLHLHHSSRRDAKSYCERLDELLRVAAELDASLDYFDLGGGIASVPSAEIAAKLSDAVEQPDDLTATLGQHARRVLGAEGPQLILEPGIGVLADAMEYVTRVTAVKARPEGTLAVCDGSLFDVNPLRSSMGPPCSVLAERPAASVRLFGATCMEIDQLGTLPALPEAGDLVLVSNVGAYAVSLAPQFCVPMAPVYAVDTGELLRSRQSLGDFAGAGQ